MLQLIGFNSNVDCQDIYVCKGGKYAQKATDTIVNFWNEERKIIKVLFGDNGRIWFGTKKIKKINKNILDLENSRAEINNQFELSEITDKIDLLKKDIEKIYELTDVKFMDMLVRIVNDFLGLSCMICEKKRKRFKNKTKFLYYENKYFWNSCNK